MRNSSINWIFLWRLSIQNHSKSSITEKRRNKAKYLTWNSIRLKFVKKTSMPNPVKSLGYIKCYSSSSPKPFQSPSIFIRYNCKKIWSWSRRLKTILEIRKMGTFLLVINNSIICKFSKNFTSGRKKTSRAVVFSFRPFFNSLKYRDHRWNLPAIWETRLLQHLLKSSASM